MQMKLVGISLFLLGTTVTPVWASVIYPQLVLGGSDTGLLFECILLVSNKLQASPWEGEVLLRTGDDEDWEGNWSVNGKDMSGSASFPVSLPITGSAVFVISGDSTIRTGYLELDGQFAHFYGDVATSFFYQLKQNGELIDSVGVPPGDSSFKFAFPVQQSSITRTGLAWVSTFTIPPYKAEEIRIGIFDSDGALLAIETLPYRGHQARFVDEIFPDLPTDFQGTTMVNCEQFLDLIVLRQDTLSSGAVQFTSTPPDNTCFGDDCSLDIAER